MEEKKISFSGVDNGIGSFMKRLQSDTKSLYAGLVEDAKKQSNSQKEQLKIIEAQIKALERANDLERQQSKILLDRKKSFLSDKKYELGLSKIQEDYQVGKYQSSLLRDMIGDPDKRKSNSNTNILGAVGVGSNLDRLKDSSAGIFQDFEKNAKKQTKSQEEQLKIIQQQIKALERKSALERESIREGIEEKKNFGTDEEKALAQAQLLKLGQEEKKDKLTLDQLRDMFEDRRDNLPPQAKQSISGEILKAGLLRDMWGLFKQTASAKSEFDLISPAASVAGTVAGASLGLFMSPGTTQAGKEIGGFLGDAYTRSLMERQKYDASRFRVKGLSGSSNAGDLSGLGMDLTQSSQLEEQIVRAVGRSVGANEIRNTAAIAKAFTMDTGLLSQYKGLSRMGASTNETQIGTFLAEGIDKSRLADALTSSISIMEQMGASMLSPSRIDALQKVTEFNRVGGPFSIGDPRSAGLINTIQGNLVNPSSPYAQAMSYSVLRQQNPNMGMLDLMIERQKGSSKYLRGVMENIAGGGGSEDFQVMQFANQVGLGGNLAAARSLFSQRGNIAAGGTQVGNMSSAEMEKIYADAVGLTPEIERSQAAVTNAFIEGFDKGIAELAIRFTDRMGKAMDSVIDRMIESRVKPAYGGAKTPSKGGRSTPNVNAH